MSDPDRPQAPQPRGARPSLPSPSPSRGRDLARSSTDGWPSVDEWRDHRARQRTSTPPPDPQASTAGSQPRVDESLTGTADPQPGGADLQPGADGSQADAVDSPALARGRFSDNGEATAGEPRTSRVTSDHQTAASSGQAAASGGQAAASGGQAAASSGQTATSGGQAAASGRAGDDAVLSGEEGAGWHSEVLAGSSWFAEEQPGGGKAGQKRTGRGRRSGRSSRRSGKVAREQGRPYEGLGTGAGPHAEGAVGFAPDGESFAGSGWESESAARSGRGSESGSGGGRDADPESVARAICLRLLTMAPKTRAQLAEALRKRNVPDEAAEAVLSRFSELGLINDEAFAAAWVDSRHHGRGLAKRALAAELRHRGVDTDTVKEAVERLDPDQEEETARRLVERKLASTRSLDPQTRTRRLAGMLARKGYSAGLAFRVIREAFEAEGIDMEEDLP
ncbi:regulatory protein RecX [Nonomuraea sp. CA-141351]|uniref:regulatory protein RecX n=1 Tax=Nonomuraea sp. CA-141351 TaxID=3239996 RepID=UPI003D91F08B